MTDERRFFVPPELGGNPARMFEHTNTLARHAALDEKLRLDPALSVTPKHVDDIAIPRKGFFARLFSRSSAVEPVPQPQKAALPEARQIFTPPPGSTGPW